MKPDFCLFGDTIIQIDALLSSVRCPDPSGSKARPLNNFVDHIR